MDNLYVFNATIQGYNHLKHTPPLQCEDYSMAFSDKNKHFYIIAVADGHGDKACMRSATGSRFAVEVTIDNLKTFANHLLLPENEQQYCMLAISQQANIMLKNLTDSIISDWQNKVKCELEDHPMTANEIRDAGHYREAYQNGEKLFHAYGTTLIAALWLPKFLVLLQQGDGRCDIFYEDGSIEQPIPWDERCMQNVTTSMCDADVRESIRHKILCLDDQSVIACYIGSDGVEDSYTYDPMEGTHVFFRELSVILSEKGTDDFLGYLNKYLPNFSQFGSGDDVSVAGIVNISSISNLIINYQSSIERYKLIDTKNYLESKLNSMKRKHDILQKRVLELKSKFETVSSLHDDYNRKYILLCDELNQLLKQKAEIDEQMSQRTALQSRLEEESTQQDEENFLQLLRRNADNLFSAISDGIQNVLLQAQSQQEDINSMISAKEAEIANYQLEIGKLEQELKALLAEKEKAENDFTKYHEKYIEIETKRQAIAIRINECTE